MFAPPYLSPSLPRETGVLVYSMLSQRARRGLGPNTKSAHRSYNLALVC